MRCCSPLFCNLFPSLPLPDFWATGSWRLFFLSIVLQLSSNINPPNKWKIGPKGRSFVNRRDTNCDRRHLYNSMIPWLPTKIRNKFSVKIVQKSVKKLFVRVTKDFGGWLPPKINWICPFWWQNLQSYDCNLQLYMATSAHEHDRSPDVNCHMIKIESVGEGANFWRGEFLRWVFSNYFDNTFSLLLFFTNLVNNLYE